MTSNAASGTRAGTATLVRLALRLDRVRLTVWVLLLGVMPAATAAQYMQLYPTEQSLDAVQSVIGNASLVALNGPLFAVTLGGLTAWKIGATELILVGLMSVLTVIRHTRTEEETGRQELVSSAVVGRHAPLTAAMVTAGLANLAVAALVALGLLGVGLPAGGAVAMGIAIGITGMLFAAVAAVAAQITESARSATGIAVAVLGGTYLLRAVGDIGPTWLTWLSPIGWAMRTRPYADEQWWVLLLPLALTAILTTTAYALVSRRDVGTGLVPQRPGPATAAPSLRSPFALAWRLQRGVLIGWVVAMAVTGAVMGGAANGIANATGLSGPVADVLARMGGRSTAVNAFLAATFGIIGFVSAAYTVQATLRLRAEESSGRLEPLLATRVGRISWALSHLAFAVVGTAVLLAVAGLAGGLAYGIQTGDVGGEVGRTLAAALVQVPAAWVMAGLGTALFGLAPRLATLVWAALIGAAVVLELGALFNLSQWVVDISPFAHIPKLPGSEFTATPLVWLTVIAAALSLAGLTGFRRRDIG
jgi:ABC-2 type transport system permease protein